jgi:hypothetical protein
MNFTDSSIQIKVKKTLSKSAIKLVVDQTFKQIKNIFSKSDIEEIAWDTGFIKRSSSKISGFDFLATLLISSVDPIHASLEKISHMHARFSHRRMISPQAMMKRINNEKACVFLKTVFTKVLSERLLALDDIQPSLLSSFSKVLIQDSSTVTLHEDLQPYFKGSGGRASKAAAKFDVIYDYKAKEYEAITVTDQSEADQKLGLKIENVLEKDSLVIRDLGYLRMDSLIQIIAKKSFFLSRLRSDIHVYLDQNDKCFIDLGTYLAMMCEHNILDQWVYITDEKLPVRLIAYKAPEDVANKRRREAKATAKKQGRTLKESTLKFYGFTVFITNIPAEIWKAEVIGTIYRIRWQIELIFKCWKSRANVYYLKGTNPERIECIIYAKLIFILLVNIVYKLAEFIESYGSARIVSMPKVFEWMRDTEKLAMIIKGSLSNWERQLFIKSVSKTMCMQKRNRKTTFERVYEAEFFNSKPN